MEVRSEQCGLLVFGLLLKHVSSLSALSEGRRHRGPPGVTVTIYRSLCQPTRIPQADVAMKIKFGFIVRVGCSPQRPAGPEGQLPLPAAVLKNQR